MKNAYAWVTGTVVCHVAVVPAVAVNTCPDVGAEAALTLTVVVALLRALVIPEVRPVAVPVALVMTPDAGVPSAGVTSVGLVSNTAKPEPVSLVRAVASCALVNDPKTAAFPTEVTCPVRLALVVTLPAVKLAAVPVALVMTPADGVPRLGVVSTGEVAVITPLNTRVDSPSTAEIA
jgi:hypothetical protein